VVSGSFIQKPDTIRASRNATTTINYKPETRNCIHKKRTVNIDSPDGKVGFLRAFRSRYFGLTVIRP
jgi:hypothetical protein